MLPTLELLRKKPFRSDHDTIVFPPSWEAAIDLFITWRYRVFLHRDV